MICAKFCFAFPSHHTLFAFTLWTFPIQVSAEVPAVYLLLLFVSLSQIVRWFFMSLSFVSSLNFISNSEFVNFKNKCFDTFLMNIYILWGRNLVNLVCLHLCRILFVMIERKLHYVIISVFCNLKWMVLCLALTKPDLNLLKCNHSYNSWLSTG